MRLAEHIAELDRYGEGIPLSLSQQVHRVEEKAEMLDSLRRAIGEAIEGGASPQQVLDEVMYRLDIKIHREPELVFDGDIDRLTEKPRIHPAWGFSRGLIGRN